MTGTRIDEIRERWKDGVPRWAKPDVDYLLARLEETERVLGANRARIEELRSRALGLAGRYGTPQPSERSDNEP